MYEAESAILEQMTEKSDQPSDRLKKLAHSVLETEAVKEVSSFIANLVGLAGGDWLAHKRRENLENLARKFAERKASLNGTHTPIGPRLGVMALQAAADEDRSEMQDLWASLLANATAGASIEDDTILVLKRMNHDHAQILRSLVHQGGAGYQYPFSEDDGGNRKAQSYRLLDDLARFGLAEKSPLGPTRRIAFTPSLFAFRFLAAVQDATGGELFAIACDASDPRSAS